MECLMKDGRYKKLERIGIIFLFLFIPISGLTKGYWYFTPFSAEFSSDIAPFSSFLDVHSFSFGIGVNRLIIGTSAMECKRWPEVTVRVNPWWNGSSTEEFFPLNVYLLLLEHEKNHKKLYLYSYFYMNQWSIEEASYSPDASFWDYRYYRIGIGTTIGSALRLSAGYFNGSYIGSSIYPRVIPPTKVNSNAFYFTMGGGVPDLLGKWKFVSPTQKLSLSTISYQVAGGLAGASLGCALGYIITRYSMIAFSELGGGIYLGANGGMMIAAIGAIPGACIGFSTGVSTVGKLLHIDGSYTGSHRFTCRISYWGNWSFNV